MEVLGPKDGPQCGLGQELSAVVGILHVGHTDGGIADPVVDHSIHRHRHTVLPEARMKAGN